MNRREFNLFLAAAGVAVTASTDTTSAQSPAASPDGPVFAMLIYPKMILLDLLGPMTVFNMTRGRVHLVWKDQRPVATDVGIPVAATHMF
jgi:cyclohexyl-isocyanide hydratase